LVERLVLPSHPQLAPSKLPDFTANLLKGCSGVLSHIT
jgi:hypothetical protein